MNIEKLFNQFKTLAEKHLGDPVDPNASDEATESAASDNKEEGFDNQSKDKVRSRTSFRSKLPTAGPTA